MDRIASQSGPAKGKKPLLVLCALLSHSTMRTTAPPKANFSPFIDPRQVSRPTPNTAHELHHLGATPCPSLTDYDAPHTPNRIPKHSQDTRFGASYPGVARQRPQSGSNTRSNTVVAADNAENFASRTMHDRAGIELGFVVCPLAGGKCQDTSVGASRDTYGGWYDYRVKAKWEMGESYNLERGRTEKQRMGGGGFWGAEQGEQGRSRRTRRD